MIILDEVDKMLSSKREWIMRTAFFTIMLVLFSILFQFAGAAEGNLSISGTKFLDLDSNGIKIPSEPGLANYTIYWDEVNNARWDPGETYVQTDENGEYSFTKLSSGTYIIRELVSSGDKFQPNSPQSGYYSVNLTDKDALGKDFGNSMPIAAEEKNNSKTDSVISILLGLIAAFLIIAGMIVLYKGWSELNSLDQGENKGKEEKRDDKKTKILILVASGFILLLIGLYLLITLLQLSRNITSAETIIMGTSFALVTPVVLTLLVLCAVLLMLYAQNTWKSENETGGMRKTIAGLLVVGLIAVVLFALSGSIKSENQNIITQYIQLVGIVIAFYFGSKATSDAYKGKESNEGNGDEGEAEKDLEVSEIIYDAKNANAKQIVIKISNSKNRIFDLDGILIKCGDSILMDKTLEGVRMGPSQEPSHILPLTDQSDIKKMDTYTSGECDITIRTSIGERTTTKLTISKITQ
jgi:uncharacterized membrane protein YidH (DUF202 family)